MRIVIAGPPASGKGTQCENIVIEYDVVHLSTGDMLREAVASGSEVGVKAKELMESGQLVDDEVIIGVVEERLASPEIEDRGFLLDGFPRTPAQAEALDDAGVEVDTFILLNVPDEVLIDRVTGRRLDPVTGEIYHMTTKPPPAGEIADRVTQRADDTPEKPGDRLKSYHANLGSIKDFYSDRLVEIDGWVAEPATSALRAGACVPQHRQYCCLCECTKRLTTGDLALRVDRNQAPDDVWVDIRRVLNDLKDAAR